MDEATENSVLEKMLLLVPFHNKIFMSKRFDQFQVLTAVLNKLFIQKDIKMLILIFNMNHLILRFLLLCYFVKNYM